ncbi:MAG: amidoligase family protein [Leuconostoc sp.]|nr:amidoligase family protein [Leuconostoc sp.]
MEEYERERQAERARIAAQQAELAGEYEEYRASRIKVWENVETPYSENPAEFKKAVDEALARKKRGEAAVPFKTENVTDGVAGDGPGTRAFGVELEFDIKRGVNKSQALRKIGEELHAAGLTSTSQQVHYHSAAQNGYQKWSFENDCTVDAELVSPIMKDTPEHWEELRQVIEIVERNGGVASTRAGSHVHVSSGSYQTKVAPHAELLRTFNDNEDVMYRMAADPKRGKHRGTRWCSPNANDREQEISKDDARDISILGQHAHALGLNFESANNRSWKKANVEFRLWDSSLDVGVIQQQVAVSVAMTDYAERKVETEGASKKSEGQRKRIGHGRNKESHVLDSHGVTKHNEQTFAESHADAAAFFDKMFRTKEHRDAAASLFALNKWQMG